MTRLLEKAFSEAAKLPPQEQDALAAELLQELAEERRWATAFESKESQAMLGQLADEAASEHQAGQTKELDPDLL